MRTGVFSSLSLFIGGQQLMRERDLARNREQGLTTSEQEPFRPRHEYRALRATIRERGTARIWVFTVGLLTWAALALATLALSAPPVATIVPLFALAAVFEAVYALHVGAERVGRYLAVFHADSWERTIGLFGRPPGAVSPDPLFSPLFLLAAIVNLEPLLPAGPTAPELTFVLGAHALFALRVLSARAAARRQRAVDGARFEAARNTQLKND
jgi:hypothetical protein